MCICIYSLSLSLYLHLSRSIPSTPLILTLYYSTKVSSTLHPIYTYTYIRFIDEK